jgi:hypothetical protein
VASTRGGEILYFSTADQTQIPTRCPPPRDLPDPPPDSWWSTVPEISRLIVVVQGMYWIDSHNQLVIYNPLSHPSAEPVHEYQAYIVATPSDISTFEPFSFEYTKLPGPPVDAFGNTALRPWFWFQQLHDWPPGITDLLICSVTAGSDIGLLGRGAETSEKWRVWTIEEENRRATVPYNMEKGEETIVAGMQLDFTAKKKLEKPLYPSEDPLECAPLPILWVLNTEGQLAGWNVMYVSGMKEGTQTMAMRSMESEHRHWQGERTDVLNHLNQLSDQQKRDRDLWEKEWLKVFPRTDKAAADTAKVAPAKTVVGPSTLTPQVPAPAEKKGFEIKAPAPPSSVAPQALTSPEKKPIEPMTTTPGSGQVALTPSSLPTVLQPSQPKFGQPSQLGASPAFGRPGQLGGVIPGQSPLGATVSQGHIFGQGSSFTRLTPSTPTSQGAGFAKYSSTHGGGFTSASQSGSFLQEGRTSSFLQPKQISSFLPAGTTPTGSFLQAGQTTSQGFAKFVSSGSSFGGFAGKTTGTGGFLGAKPSTGYPPFGATTREAATPRIELPTETRSQSHNLDNESEDEVESREGRSTSEEEESGSEEDVDDLAFEVSLNEDTTRLAAPSSKFEGETITPEESITPFVSVTKSPTLERDYVDVSTVSPVEPAKPISLPELTNQIEATLRAPAQPSPRPIPISQPSTTKLRGPVEQPQTPAFTGHSRPLSLSIDQRAALGSVSEPVTRAVTPVPKVELRQFALAPSAARAPSTTSDTAVTVTTVLV